MLTPEAARDRLEAQKAEGWDARRARRVATLGSKGSAAATLVLKAHDWGNHEQDCGPALEALSDRRRTALFDAFVPGLGAHVQRMWAAGVERPYQTGWSRRAFRAPNDPAVSLPARRDAFLGLALALEGYDAEPEWVARWAPYLAWEDRLGGFLAAVIDHGGDDGGRVYDVLVASAEGTDEIGAMGHHVPAALLIAGRPDGWELVERLLLAAQRQEGLRQVILEVVDGAHPDAFRRMLGVILEHGLTRFSATVRAADVWLGLGEDAGDRKRLEAMLERVASFLDDEGERTSAIERGEPQDAYLALWAAACRDAPATVARAEALLREDDVERRWVAAHLLAQLQLTSSAAALAPALEDPDLRVAAVALRGIAGTGTPDLFEPLERLLGRFGKARVELDPIVWPWTGGRFERQEVAGQLRRSLGDRPPGRLIPHLKAMDPYDRGAAVTDLTATPHDEVRAALLALVGDASPHVRERAIEAAAKLTVSDEEAAELEALLTRKAGDLRRGVISLLLARGDEQALAGAERLLASGDEQQRAAGRELRSAVRGEHATAEVTRDDGFGLRVPDAETPPRPPEDHGVALATEATARMLEELDALVHEHRDERIASRSGEKALLGDAGWQFPRALEYGVQTIDAGELALREVWEGWMDAAAGHERLRAVALPVRTGEPYMDDATKRPAAKALLGGLDPPSLRFGVVVGAIAEWLAYLHPPDDAAAFLLDAAETLLASMSGKDLVDDEERAPFHAGTWRDHGWLEYLRLARAFAVHRPQLWGTDDYRRLWALERWVERPERPGGRLRLRRKEPLRVEAPALESLLVAHRAGAATDADAVAFFLGPGDEGSRVRALAQVSGRRPHRLVAGDERFAAVVDRIRRRVVEVELARGDLASPASQAALALSWSGGLDVLTGALTALGRDKLVRGWTYDGEARATVLSRMIRATLPEDGDELAVDLPDRRLVELAAYAPQWARHVEAAVGWPGLADAIWWMHAHTKDESWTVPSEVRDAWTAEVAERTPLSAGELLDGAVDVAWFERVHTALGEKRWRALDKAARYCSTGGGHKRAQLFADAMRGAVDEADLRERIEGKRHKDAARALGLLALARDADDAVLDRYRVLQEFVRTSRRFGSQRQASEKRAGDSGLDNLARTAGYRDQYNSMNLAASCCDRPESRASP